MTSTPIAMAPHPLRWFWLAGATLGVFATGVASTALSMALPTIVRDLALPVTMQLSWIVNAPVLTFALLLVPAAVLGNLLGHARLHLLGAICFAVASGVGAIAGSGATLVFARLGQGVGAALMVPQPVGYALAHLGRVERTVVCALFGVAFVSGTAVGPLIGATIVEHASWRAVFWLALALGLVAGLASVPMIAQRLPIRLDLPALLVAAVAVPAFLAIMLPLVAKDASDWPAWFLAPFAGGCLLFAGCLVLAARRRGVRAGVGAPVAALLVLAGSGHLSTLQAYLQLTAGHSAQTVSYFGVLAAIGALFGAAMAVVVGLWLDARVATVAGGVFIAAGVVVSLITINSLGLVSLGADQALTGFGLGLLVTTLVRESSSGLVFAALPVGTAAGAAMASLLTGRLGSGDLVGSRRDTATDVLIGSLVLLAMAVVVALLLGPRARAANTAYAGTSARLPCRRGVA